MDACVCALTNPGIAKCCVPSITLSAWKFSGTSPTAAIRSSVTAMLATGVVPSGKSTVAFLISVFNTVSPMPVQGILFDPR